MQGGSKLPPSKTPLLVSGHLGRLRRIPSGLGATPGGQEDRLTRSGEARSYAPRLVHPPPRRVSFTLPPCGGGLGWGVSASRHGADAAGAPPHPSRVLSHAVGVRDRGDLVAAGGHGVERRDLQRAPDDAAR